MYQLIKGYRAGEEALLKDITWIFISYKGS